MNNFKFSDFEYCKNLNLNFYLFQKNIFSFALALVQFQIVHTYLRSSNPKPNLNQQGVCNELQKLCLMLPAQQPFVLTTLSFSRKLSTIRQFDTVPLSAGIPSNSIRHLRYLSFSFNDKRSVSIHMH